MGYMKFPPLYERDTYFLNISHINYPIIIYRA